MFNDPVFWDAIAVDDLSRNVNDLKRPATLWISGRDDRLLDDMPGHRTFSFLKKGPGNAPGLITT
jgi:hypothetical protein